MSAIAVTSAIAEWLTINSRTVCRHSNWYFAMPTHGNQLRW
jgi:hypothetical protein